MRFKTSLANEPQHKDVVTCVTWNTTEEIYSCGDDHVLMKWNLITNETTKVTDFPNDFYPTDLHYFPKLQSSIKKQGLDILLISTADGKFHLVNKNGRIEKSVDAHKGAIFSARWSYDGAGLLTAGEDGQVKVWSRSGMLRSTVMHTDCPVYCALWSPDSNQILYTSGKNLTIKPLAPNNKPLKWKAHDGLILKAAWNSSNNLIVSGGEDCRYKVWDTYGRQLYCSSVHDYPITSVSWTPEGDLFAVGSFNTLRLCDKCGWSYSLEKVRTGSLFNISWSSDGTHIAGACGNGHVIFAHTVERRLEWKNYEATVTDRKSISVHNVSDDTWEKLEFPDRVIRLSFGYNHLVVITPTQCHIYSTKNWNTPAIFDLREGTVSMLLLAERHFVIVGKSYFTLHGYDGRLLCSPKWGGMQPETLSPMFVSTSSDTLAVRDQVDDRVVHLFEIGSTRSIAELPTISHSMSVMEIALNQAGSSLMRQLAIIDKNRDLYVSTIRGMATRKLRKLGSMVQCLRWNCDANILAAIQDTRLSVWYYPPVLHIDKRLVKKTVLVKDISEFGKTPVIVSFVGNHLGIRRTDGSLVNCSISPYPSVLHNYAASSNWSDALKLCRLVKDPILWACLAAIATHAKELNTAEEAYAAIDEVDKVLYIQRIKEIPVAAAKVAEVSLLAGSTQDAENTLLQNGLIYRAIMMNIDFYNWTRAMELAIKHKTHIDTVLYHRQKYLNDFSKTETLEMFLQLHNEVEIDEEKITAKERMELEAEQQNYSIK
ncbi:intraflagellar transport protein 80 homolog isoform X1 [Schistocerca cancellata]|uniref:intraflagellar transport protein 80 homolog isoform X1 n=1 Tax=Schistocerca cancellata TaxID=274614 RepID=UPI002117B5EA|nr:intraflagellar transport protein 80 homolog isoform X1 [Schistocerca cancellata]